MRRMIVVSTFTDHHFELFSFFISFAIRHQHVLDIAVNSKTFEGWVKFLKHIYTRHVRIFNIDDLGAVDWEHYENVILHSEDELAVSKIPTRLQKNILTLVHNEISYTNMVKLGRPVIYTRPFGDHPETHLDLATGLVVPVYDIIPTDKKPLLYKRERENLLSLIKSNGHEVDSKNTCIVLMVGGRPDECLDISILGKIQSANKYVQFIQIGRTQYKELQPYISAEIISPDAIDLYNSIVGADYVLLNKIKSSKYTHSIMSGTVPAALSCTTPLILPTHLNYYDFTSDSSVVYNENAPATGLSVSNGKSKWPHVHRQFEALMKRSCEAVENILFGDEKNIVYPDIPVKLVIKNSSKWLNPNDFAKSQYKHCINSWKRLYTHVRVAGDASIDTKEDKPNTVVVDARTFLLRRLSLEALDQDLRDLDLFAPLMKQFTVQFPDLHANDFEKLYNEYDPSLYKLQNDFETEAPMTSKNNNPTIVILCIVTAILVIVLSCILVLYFKNKRKNS